MRVIRKNKVTDILPSDINKKVILLDIDNTLAKQDDNAPFENTVEWSHTMRENGFSLVVVSNNRQERVEKFASQYNLPFVFRAKKPLPIGFNKARKLFSAEKKDCVVFGDQIFTDVLCARLSGCTAVLVEPMKPEGYSFYVVKRKLEAPILRRYHGKERL